MKFIKTHTFQECFDKLPDELQRAAKESFKLLKDHPYPPYHPSLLIKKMQGWDKIWEGHVTEGCVFTFHEEYDHRTGEKTFVFRKIGTHKIYKNP